MSFTVAVGEIFALVGPNGAGKTTTVEVLEGYRRPTAGRVSVLGMDPQRAGRDLRERIGIVLQEAGFDEDFTVRELLELYVSFYPCRRGVDELIDLVGLADKRSHGSRHSPAGNAVGSTSPWAWPETRTCCSWTNPPPGSTRPRAGTPGSWWTPCGTWARPCC